MNWGISTRAPALSENSCKCCTGRVRRGPGSLGCLREAPHRPPATRLTRANPATPARTATNASSGPPDASPPVSGIRCTPAEAADDDDEAVAGTEEEPKRADAI